VVQSNLKDQAVTDVIFDRVSKPKTVGIKISDLHAEVKRIEAPRLRKMAPHQVNRWNTTRSYVQDQLIQVIGGDRDLATLTGEDTSRYRDFLSQNIVAKEIMETTANKRLSEISGMFRAVDKNRKLVGIAPMRHAYFVNSSLTAPSLTASLLPHSPRVVWGFTNVIVLLHPRPPWWAA